MNGCEEPVVRPERPGYRRLGCSADVEDIAFDERFAPNVALAIELPESDRLECCSVHANSRRLGFFAYPTRKILQRRVFGQTRLILQDKSPAGRPDQRMRDGHAASFQVPTQVVPLSRSRNQARPPQPDRQPDALVAARIAHLYTVPARMAQPSSPVLRPWPGVQHRNGGEIRGRARCNGAWRRPARSRSAAACGSLRPLAAIRPKPRSPRRSVRVAARAGSGWYAGPPSRCGQALIRSWTSEAAGTRREVAVDANRQWPVAAQPRPACRLGDPIQCLPDRAGKRLRQPRSAPVPWRGARRGASPSALPAPERAG